jgi:hypothetical protein
VFLSIFSALPTPTTRPRTARYNLVARPFRSPTFALSSWGAVLGRHGCKLMAVPRGFSRGFLAAETWRPLPLPSRPLKQTHGASPKGSTLPCTMQNATLGARGASPREVAHAERRWRMHGGNKTPPCRGSAAAHGGEGTLLAAGPREARSYSMQRHVESPHLNTSTPSNRP